MQLFNHQQQLVDQDPKKCLIAWGTGGGKSAVTLSLAKGKTLIIVPKIVRDDKVWEKNLEKLGLSLDIDVLSKEDFKKNWDKLCRYDTIIIDELHNCTGIQPSLVYKNKQPKPKTSQIFDACINFIRQTNPDRLYLLTATPVKNPLAVYATGLMLGKDWDFYQFRSIYYTPVNMNHREIWMPKKDTATQERLGKVVQSLGVTGKLDDWVDVPDQTHKIINVPLTQQQIDRLREIPFEYPDPLVATGKKHQIEQGVLKGDEYSKSEVFATGKLEVIENLREEFGKVLVFAKYTEQIEQIEKHFTSICPVITITGATKDRGEAMILAERLSDCVVIVQSTISAGYELPSFRCTIYASQSYSYVDLNQSQGRTLRINNLSKNLYVYLLSGEIDKAVYKALETKEDFNLAIYAKVI